MNIWGSEISNFLLAKSEEARRLAETLGMWECYYGLLLSLALMRRGVGRLDRSHALGDFYARFTAELDMFELKPEEKEAVLDVWSNMLSIVASRHVTIFPQ